MTIASFGERVFAAARSASHKPLVWNHRPREKNSKRVGQSEQRKNAHKPLATQHHHETKWIKRSSKMMMKIFFLNSFFPTFAINTHGARVFFSLYYYWMHRNLISMEDTSHFERGHAMSQQHLRAAKERTDVPNDPSRSLTASVCVCMGKKSASSQCRSEKLFTQHNIR